MTNSATVDVEDVLDQFTYAETITREIGGLTVELAEANPRRNPDFAAAVLEATKKSKDAGNKAGEIHEDLEIWVFAKTLLKSWNMARDGKPVAMGDEAEAVLSTRPGRNLFRQLGGICATEALFKGPSKKKPSSASTPKPSRSATSRKRSSKGTKRVASQSRKGSKPT